MPPQDDAAWVADWFDAVQDGSAKMSQRARTSIDRHGGLEAAVQAARKRGIHLIQLTDDQGKQLHAASREPFEILC